MEFTAHVPPAAYQTSKRHKSKRVKDYMDAVAGYAMQAKLEYGRWPLDRIYRLVVASYFEDARIRDWDNSAQPVNNALQSVLYVDDWQVQVGTSAKFIDRERPRVKVICEVIG